MLLVEVNLVLPAGIAKPHRLTSRRAVQVVEARGSLNAVAIQLLLDYTKMIEANSSHPPLEDPAA